MKENLMEIDRAKEPYTYITISSLEKMGNQIARLQEQKQKVIALIKDGRFIEALQELEK